MNDGMGAGAEAHHESAVALNLLQKLLTSGFSSEITVKVVNTALFLRSGKERFVTLDIVIVNQVSGQTDFIKIGGAPSIIYSSKGIKVIQAVTPPAGILDNLELHTFRHMLVPGNAIIMMSDGVWEAIHNAGGPSGWLEDALKNINLADPVKAAKNLLLLAQKASGNKARDDMCIQVARIEQQDIA